MTAPAWQTTLPILRSHRHIYRDTIIIIQIPAERLSNFQIGTSNTSPQTKAPTLVNYDVCATHSGALGAGETKAIECNAKGHFLIIQLKGKNYLTLCEVEVFGGKENITVYEMEVYGGKETL